MKKIDRLTPRSQAEIEIIADALLVGTDDEIARMVDATNQCTGLDLMPALRVAEHILTNHGV